MEYIVSFNIASRSDFHEEDCVDVIRPDTEICEAHTVFKLAAVLSKYFSYMVFKNCLECLRNILPVCFGHMEKMGNKV